jgi:NTE family protein
VAAVLSPARQAWREARGPGLAGMLPAAQVLLRLRPGQAIRVFQDYMELASRTHTELRLEIDRPEVIVRPEVWRVGLFDEPSVVDMIGIGERAMEAELGNLRAQYSLPRRWARLVRQARAAAGT